jgi:hypothetical protein
MYQASPLAYVAIAIPPVDHRLFSIQPSDN